jgi:outer membrane protein TolC
MTVHRNWLATAGAALLTACAAPHGVTPPQEVPQAFEVAASGGQWPAQEWYRGFGSDELDSLVDAAAHANLDIESARARVAQADARARQAGAAILPSIDAQGTANYFAGHSSQGVGPALDLSANLEPPIFEHGKVKEQRDE